MKKHLLLLMGLVSILSLQAQETGKSFVGAKILFIDHGNPNDLDSLDITNGLEVSFRRNFGKYLSVGVPLKFAQASVPEDLNKRNTFSVDGVLRLQYYEPEHILVPYLFGGAGYVLESGGENYSQFPVGAGLDIRIGTSSYLSVQGEYRVSSIDNRSNMQAGIGLTYRLGDKKLDTDEDGIPDEDDLCPNEKGPAILKGCPDTDGDGLPDQSDQCPDEPGTEETGGCPDTDGDGVLDKDDACPEVAGPESGKGCPDSDGDGVPDNVDLCPEIEGDPDYLGCPDSDGDGVADQSDRCPNEYGTLDGCPDSDNDGLADLDDECPDEAGTISRRGCPEPDRDGDGVPDSQDDCPDEAGTADGCPETDSDNDGVPDAQDACPDESGPVDGCPDRDGDGVRDSQDACPDQFGALDGCPDSDSDGVADLEDACPEEAGPATNRGCPEIQEEDRETLDYAMRAVRFNPNTANLRVESHEVLDQIAAIMNRYPGYQLTIIGHTDGVGDGRLNQILSEERAKSCFQYLLVNGVEPGRMDFTGYGETRPIATNDTAEGRRLNRRVEFNLKVNK